MQFGEQSLQVIAKRQMEMCRSDYIDMDATIDNLHKKYSSITDESHHGKYVISQTKFSRWSQAKAKEICPNDVRMQKHLAAKFESLSYVDIGKDEVIKIDLNYGYGDRQYTKCVFIMVKALPNDKLGVIYGLHSYSWAEKYCWKLNEVYWERPETKRRLKNWLLYRAAKKALACIQNGF
eukprot:464456_1